MSGYITPYRAMRAITPYGTSAIQRSVRSGVGTGLARYAAYKGAKYAGRAMKNYMAKRIQRAYKKSKASRRTEKGSRQTTRQFGNISDAGIVQTINHRQLIVDPIPFPIQGAEVGFRLGSTIRVSGIKLCERIVNTSDKAVRLHWCLLQPKDRGPQTANTVRESFFRQTKVNSNDPTLTVRSYTFNDAGVAAPYDMRYDCYPLNPDKFNIITHKKILLNPKDVLVNGSVGDDFINPVFRRYALIMERYWSFKKKRMTFNDSQDDVPEHPILRVMWFQIADPTDNPLDPTDITINRTKESVVYFKNGLN